jgi:thioredoxin reductase (NADPH)
LRLTLLSRAYCHLCEEMEAAVRPLAQARGASLAVLDVDAPAHAALEAEWSEKVPALFLGDAAGGTLLCFHRLDAARVAAALDGGPGEVASRAKIR